VAHLYLVELQNLDVVHLDVVHLGELRPLDVVVDAELRHQLKMDYYLDVADVVQCHRQKMDYYLDVVQLVRQELVVVLTLALSLHLLQ